MKGHKKVLADCIWYSYNHNYNHKSFDDTLNTKKVDRKILDFMSLGNKPQPHTML